MALELQCALPSNIITLLGIILYAGRLNRAPGPAANTHWQAQPPCAQVARRLREGRPL